MFALCFVLGGTVALIAQDTTSYQYRTETESQYPQQDASNLQQDRERIQATELPEEVKRQLEGEDYRGWLISGAFRATGSEDPSMPADTTGLDPSINAQGMEDEEIYIVELKNGAETKTVYFDSNGQILEGMDDTENSPANPYGQDPADPNRPYTPDQPDEMNPNDQMNQNDQWNQNQNQNDRSQWTPNDQPDQMETPDEMQTPSDRAIPDEPNAIDQPDQAGQESGNQWQTHPTPAPGEAPRPAER